MLSFIQKVKFIKMKIKYLSIVFLLVILASCSKDSSDVTIESPGMIETEMVECDLALHFTSDISNSTLLVRAENGVAPYTYKWSNGSTNESITDVDSGNYSVDITDAEGCLKSQSVALDILVDCEGPFGLLVSYDSESATLTANVQSDVDYFVSWSNAEITESISVISGETYEVEVINTVGCVLWVSYLVP